MSSMNPQQTAGLEKSELYRGVFYASPDYITIGRLKDGLCLDVNPGYERFAGLKREQLIGRPLLDAGVWPDPADRQIFIDAFSRNGELQGFPTRLLSHSGEIRHVDASVHMVEIDGDKFLIAVMRDVTERKRNEEELRQYRERIEQMVAQRTAELRDANTRLRDPGNQLAAEHNQLLQNLAETNYLATHDGLTGLPNRLMFSNLLGLAIPTAARYKRNFALFRIDLDRFRLINDRFGRDAGDNLLRDFTARFKKALRTSDIVARLEGDEFVVLVQEVSNENQAATVARKLLDASLKSMLLSGQECRVTASIGIAMFPADGNDEQILMKSADIAMCFAKEEGKNNYQFFSKDIKSQFLERLTLEANLRQALEHNEFSLHYQARVDLRNGRIKAVEALLRWQSPTLGSVSPMQFIPVAEETGLIVQIGKWVLETACAQNLAWQRQGLPQICMAVNLSARQFTDEHLLEDLAAVLKNTGMSPRLLELEITEGMVMHNTGQAVRLLTAIKATGVRLAIDDFGTGCASLGQLKNFPIDTLKVDRSFIRYLAANPGDKAITRTIIGMGKNLNLTVVAEGVETKEQEAFLREHACDEMQGYYFSKPVTADAFATLLKNQKY